MVAADHLTVVGISLNPALCGEEHLVCHGSERQGRLPEGDKAGR
jgi:hypothetical protein